jgi:hypothetical protein
MLRGLSIGQVIDYWLDFGVLTVALVRMAQRARSSVTGSECWGATFTKVSLA